MSRKVFSVSETVNFNESDCSGSAVYISSRECAKRSSANNQISSSGNQTIRSKSWKLLGSLL